MSDMCRLCGYEGAEMDLLSSNKSWNRFYNILPFDITHDDEHLPKTFCELCDIQIGEVLEFFDRIEEVDRNLRLNAALSPVLSDVQPTNERKVNLKRHLVNDIVDQIKFKNNISIRKIPVNQPNTPHKSLVDPLDISHDAVQTNNYFKVEVVTSSDEDMVDNEINEPIYNPSNNCETTEVSNGKEIIVVDVANPKYVCCRCGGSFHSAALLKNHLFVASACHDAYLSCKYCKKKFETRRQRTKHESFHERKKVTEQHKCATCPRIFYSLALLAIHQQKCTSDSSGGRLGITFKCTECGDQFNSSAQLINHTDNHAISKKIRRHLSCEICGQNFDTKPLYHDHIRIHPEMMKFPCNLCDKKFHTARLLHTHRYEHSGIKSNVCQDCGKAFVKKSSLNNHYRTQHSGETPFACQICGMNFSTNDRLRIHQYKHIFKD